MRPLLLLFNLCFLFSMSYSSAQWKSLFNGRSISGWEQKNGKAKFYVQNGEIVGETVADTPNSFLCTKKEYGDFVLELEIKLERATNSGIQFRSLSKKDYRDYVVHGYQMEVDPSERSWSGGIYDESRRGWLYIPNINPSGKTKFEVNKWNTYRIEAIGNNIRTWINGTPVSYLVDDLTARGFIALQVHGIGNNKDKEGIKIRWRNIKIQTKNLKPAPFDDTPVVNLLSNKLSAQERHQGVKLLFNGRDFDGWRDVHGIETPHLRWHVGDGTMTLSSSDGSETGNDIVTREVYRAFDLTFDFKITEGANSGVKYFVDESFDSDGKSGIGLEYQILDNESHPDAKLGVVGNRTLGGLYDLIPPERITNGNFKKRIGDWNHGRIVAFPDGRVEHWLNGFKTVEYVRGSSIFDALVARSKYSKFEGFGIIDEGPILLQDHGDKVSFKNIKIRTL